MRQTQTPLFDTLLNHAKNRVVSFHTPGHKNGRGIDPSHLDRIFEPFQSFAAVSRTRGAGMGLAIVKKIVEKRGGRISVESELGKGTAFHVRLPRR